MYQHVIVIGNLGDDPEAKYTQGGTEISVFSVAANESWKDRDGNKQSRATWFKCEAWDKLAGVCNQYLRKGSLVAVDGTIVTSQWEDDKGITRYSWKLRVRNMRMLGGRDDDDEQEDRGRRRRRRDDDEEPRQRKRRSRARQERDEPDPEPDDDDDIPF